MGCDIHLHTEVKIGGQWHHYSAPEIDRDYTLFGKMAGVRGGGDPIAPPRGLPADVSAVTALDATYWDADGHHHSWLGAAEIWELEEWLRKLMDGDPKRPDGWEMCREHWGYLFGNPFGSFHEFPRERREGIEDVRFVFWFDN
jgi:hypothetical protein